MGEVFQAGSEMVQKESILGFGGQCGLGEAVEERIREEGCGRVMAALVNSGSLDYILIDKEDGSEQRVDKLIYILK